MNSSVLKLFFLLISVVYINSFLASHVPGGNITYECLGNNEYEVTLTIYEDCGNSFIGDFGTLDEDIDITSDCGDNLDLTLTNTMFQNEISQLCPSSIGQSECNGGSLPGIYMHQWKGTITLPSQCDSWRFEFDDCCRNSSSNLVGTTSDYYFYASLNNIAAPCNSSPTITAPPIPYYCVNQPVCYNLGIVEPDGDSLVYSLVEASEDATNTVAYQNGFSGAQPIAGITIDSETGLINFTPTAQGNYVVVIKVDEYDDNGVLLGSIIQDFTFEIANCSNQIISCGNSNISNVNGSVTQVDPTTLEMCEGVPFSFDLEFTDPDAGDSLFIESNIPIVLQGAITTITYPNSPSANVIKINVAWTPPPGSSNNNNSFTVTVRDNACPVSGQQTLVYNIQVIGSTYAGLDLTICEGDSVNVTAENGTVFNWFDISGDPINVGTNFSCNNCASPIINPAITSTYEVVSDLSGNCVNRDTITINVAPNFTYTIDQSSASSCLGAEIQLEVTPDTPNNYTYLWTPSDDLDNATIANPIFSPSTPGTFVKEVTVTSPLGCIKYDSIEVNVISEFAPDLSLSRTNLSVLSCEDSAIFNIDLGGGIPAQCGPSATLNCSGGSTQVLGNNDGVNGATFTNAWPAPFGNYYRNAKHQFLYTAAELNAIGFTGGKINKISFEVTDMNSSTSNYNSYSVRIGCVGINAITDWQTGLTQVFGPQDISINTGWNDLVFSTAYEWDGISNLVIEICYDNLAETFTQNASSPYTNTPFVSSIYYRSDSQNACSSNSDTGTLTRRPVTRFSFCPTTPDPSAFNFEWTVNGAPYTVTNYNEPLRFYDTPDASIDYHLVVTNIAGGCADSIDFSFTSECLEPRPRIEVPTCNGGDDGLIKVGAIGDNGPLWKFELLDNLGIIVATQDNITDSATFDNLVAGQYTIRVTDTVGLTADSIVVVEEPTPIVLSVGNDTTICIGGTAVLNATVTGGNGINSYLFNWTGTTGTTGNENIMPVVDSTYLVYVLDSLSCSSDTLNITVNIHPEITTITNLADTVCPGDPASLEVTASGGSGVGFTYEWFDDNGVSLGTGTNISVTSITDNQYYYVQVTDDCETPMALDSVIVRWHIEPHVNMDADIYDGCFPILVNFNNLTPVDEVNTLEWTFGDGGVASNNPNPPHAYLAPGSYDVNLSVTSPEGCTNDTTIINMITAYDYPVADFTEFPNPANIFEPTVQFTNTSTNGATLFNWYFRDSTLLGTSINENPEFTFSTQVPGVYPVSLLVTNDNGCQDSVAREVVVNGVYSFYAPSAFTPNQDGVNDIFLPQGEGVEGVDYSLIIFNRNGQPIFDSTNPLQGWDGMYLGTLSEQDVYVWRINTVDTFTGEAHEYFGYVTLIK